MKCLVTGCSEGIGFELAKKFCEEGHQVLAISRNGERLGQLKEEIGSDEITVLPVDITGDHTSIKEVLDSWNNLDILVHNAGRIVNKPFDEITGEEVRLVYETNLIAPFRLTQTCLPYLKRSEWSHVVTIGSMGGVSGSSKFPGLSAYSSSKGALTVLTECLAEEYKGSGIRFNNLALGAVQTKMLEEAFPGYTAPISAKGMAKYIAEFALKDWRYYNGKILPVSTSNP